METRCQDFAFANLTVNVTYYLDKILLFVFCLSLGLLTSARKNICTYTVFKRIKITLCERSPGNQVSSFCNCKSECEFHIFFWVRSCCLFSFWGYLLLHVKTNLCKYYILTFHFLCVYCFCVSKNSGNQVASLKSYICNFWSLIEIRSCRKAQTF